jgi:phosphate transport system substrate-binding protein
MKTKHAIVSFLAATLATVSVSPALTAFAAPARDAQVQLNGSGATFPQPLYEEWAYNYNDHVDTKVQINYSGVGSGQGKTDILNGTVDFAGTDAPLTNAEAAKKALVQVPTVAGAVVLVFNLPGITNLTLDASTVAGIYLGKIAKWNDAAIAKLNPGVKLPATTILVVHRSDGSGTTNIFTTYLAVASEEWRSTVSPSYGTTVSWPADKLKRGVGGKANAGVAAAVQSTVGAIGYVELAYALNNKIAFAKMVNAAGKVVTASTASTIAAMRTAWFDNRMASTIVNSKEADAWPIAGFTYILLNQDYKDCNKAVNAVQWVVWGITSDEAKASAVKQSYAPLPASIVPSVGEKLLTVKCNGNLLFNK